MRSFVHTVQKNQMLMMTPGSLGRSNIMKSFIKQSASKTDVKVDTLFRLFLCAYFFKALWNRFYL